MNRIHRPSAFTLIELLIVIAIIALLAAILFPVFAAARSKARQSACLSNQRQVGTGIRMYCDDWDGVVPESTHTGGGIEERCWIFQLRPYVASCDDIRLCPADPAAADRRAEGGTSYVLNEYVVVPERDEDPLPMLDQFPRPADTFLLFEISDEKGASYTEDHTHSRNWFKTGTNQWARVLSDIEPDRHRVGNVANTPNRRTAYDRTAGVANYLYVDGHVKSIPASRIKGWADQNVNFALPPL